MDYKYKSQRMKDFEKLTWLRDKYIHKRGEDLIRFGVACCLLPFIRSGFFILTLVGIQTFYDINKHRKEYIEARDRYNYTYNTDYDVNLIF